MEQISAKPASESPVVVCGQTAAECICDREPNHDGQPHLCKCLGSWLGTFDAPDFDVVAWPAAVRS